MTQQTGEAAFNDDIAVQTDYGMVDLLLSAAPVSNVSGSSNAIVMTFSDISNLRTLERSLQDVLNETVTIYGAQSRLAQADALDDALDVLIFALQNLGFDESYVVLRDLATGDLLDSRSANTPLESAESLRILFDNASMRYIEVVSVESVGEQAETELARANIHRGNSAVEFSISDAPVGWIGLGSHSPSASAMTYNA